MPVFQLQNGDMEGLHQPYAHDYALLSEPLGGFGVWNGNFDQGPDGQYPRIENWTVGALGAGCTIARYSVDSFTGAYCVRATTPGGVAAGYLDCNRWFPVSTSVNYYADIATRGSAAGTTIQFNAYCYSRARAFLGTVNIVSGAIGVNWVWRQTVVGPGGTAWVAGTYYARLSIYFNYATAGWTQADCVWFFPVL